MIENIFSGAMAAAADVLAKTQEELRGLPCPTPTGPFPLKLKDLGGPLEAKLLDKLPSGYARGDANTDHVYVFKLGADSPTAYGALCTTFEAARGMNQGVTAYCRAIREHTAPGALYVGRSKHLRARIAQHLDDKTGGTYAMHLGRWAKGLDAEISISYITFTGRTDSLVQAVEDGLWKALKPALGKHGGK